MKKIKSAYTFLKYAFFTELFEDFAYSLLSPLAYSFLQRVIGELLCYF